MTAKKDWYRYTDETGKHWRIETTPDLAEVGGLPPTDQSAYKPLPETIKPRYVWLSEVPRPKDRLRRRVKVIIDYDRLTFLLSQARSRVHFQIGNTEMAFWSYYGEVATL